MSCNASGAHWHAAEEIRRAYSISPRCSESVGAKALNLNATDFDWCIVTGVCDINRNRFASC
jgi:hypothetical protein